MQFWNLKQKTLFFFFNFVSLGGIFEIKVTLSFFSPPYIRIDYLEYLHLPLCCIRESYGT